MYADLINDKRFLSRIVKDWFGVDLEDFPERIVITPLPFEKAFGEDFLKILGKRGIKYKFVDQGFWLFNRIQRNLLIDNYLFAYTGMGNTFATDSSIILRNIENLEEVIFVGSIGSTNENLQTGDIVLVNKSYNWNFSESISLEGYIKSFENVLKDLKYYKGSVASVPNVFEYETKEHIEKIKDKVYGIDLEIHYIARTLKDSKRFIPIVMVADVITKDILFYTEKYEKAKKEREESRRRILLSILDYLEL